LVGSTLGSNQKPVFQNSIGHPAKAGSPVDVDPTWQPTQPVIHSADTSNQWYNSVAGTNTRGSNFKITTNIACFTPGVVK
jgi:hypothetical protein